MVDEDRKEAYINLAELTNRAQYEFLPQTLGQTNFPMWGTYSTSPRPPTCCFLNLRRLTEVGGVKRCLITDSERFMSRDFGENPAPGVLHN